jgi:hypothetical protein
MTMQLVAPRSAFVSADASISPGTVCLGEGGGTNKLYLTTAARPLGASGRVTADLSVKDVIKACQVSLS